MSITISGSSVTFNDGSTQTTTANGQSYDSIGSTILAIYTPASSISADTNVAGSNLRFKPTSTYPHNTTDIWSLPATSLQSYGWLGLGSGGGAFSNSGAMWSFSGQSGGNSTYRDTAAAYLAGGGSSLSGTWKKLSSPPTYVSSSYSYGTAYYWFPALFRRIS